MFWKYFEMVGYLVLIFFETLKTIDYLKNKKPLNIGTNPKHYVWPHLKGF
jgi:hypothetical protein